ncbi:peroxin 5 [Klebsormidium nitens]|uniref:Peroxin 5 n=1 Tax=Klebsormidium nitens TaxID=105231 RepID=A0A1Y1HTS2_KLENI|nr:peroxin 5 [Klebsormidium nitens]|eukprot:GAQ79926.1 peroxin 5 [Klebsormidium nitens]
MSLRDLVMGGAGCSAPGVGPSTANPMAGLADSLIGGAAKQQERLRELPGLAGPEVGPSSQDFGRSRLQPPLPGFELDHGIVGPSGPRGQEFLQGFNSHNQGFSDAWDEALRPGFPHGPPMGPEAAHFEDFERIYSQQGPMLAGPMPEGAPQQVLAGFLHSFLDSSRTAAPFPAVKLPELGLSQMDKERIRNRSSIMARHIFADKGPMFVENQVNALLQSLEIDRNPELEHRMHGPMGGAFREFEDYWAEGAPPVNGPGHPDQWAAEFQNKLRLQNGNHWGEEYARENSSGGTWGDEFAQEQGDQWAEEMAAQERQRLGLLPGQQAATLDQTRQLAETLSQNKDPKFQNSKFLQFVSKMSRGELIMEDNAVREAAAGDGWANEFQVQQTRGAFGGPQQANDWASEFHREQQQDPQGWADEYAQEQAQGPKDWADEFGDQVAKGALDIDESGWVDSYNQFLDESRGGEASTSNMDYKFAEQNPYMGHPAPLREGQDLFRRGLLSEAVLALEAEVLKNPNSCEGWRLLGNCHAENDDDRQAIAAMLKAREADPTNLEVLLSLGVSHTNELEQQEALGYLRSWLQNHPRYGKLVPQDGSAEGLGHEEVVNMFRAAVREAPEDADLHTVLGVLFNLSREYDLAIEAFRQALQLKPKDYSLWNKLGATQANSARSADAVQAYQEALDLKPNYVRAWSNMGIGYANQGRYEESIRYYVQALQMNPMSDNAWNYLRISLSCAGRMDMVELVDRKDLDVLAKEYPL